MSDRWQCEHCNTPQTTPPAHTETHPGATLYFCEACTQ